MSVFSDDPRIERRLHHEFYTPMQRVVQEADRAISEARDFIYAAMNPAFPEDALEWMAKQWLENFGRDKLREPDLPEELRGE